MSRADGADAPYWDGLEQGKLMLPRCNGCDRWIWPAAHRCGACGSTGVRWVERSMTATVFSWTRTWHAFGGAESLGLPFTTVLVDIDDCGIRLLGRLDDPDRQWKFDPNDIAQRKKWDGYQRAYETAIRETDADHAPWYVVPSNSKTQRNLVVATLLLETLQGMKLAYPPPDPKLSSFKVE